MIKAFLYDANGADREVDLSSIELDRLEDDQLLWLVVVGREKGELRELGDLLKLKTQTLADLDDSVGHDLLNNYGSYFHCTVHSPAVDHGSEERLPPADKSTRIDFLVSEKWLLTVASEEIGFLTDFRDQDRSETLIGILNPASLAASLLDWHLAVFLSGLEKLESFLDNLDVRLLAGRPVEAGRLKEIVAARRYIAFLRRVLAPQRNVFYGLSRPDFALVAGSEALEPFRALERRFERALGSIEHGHELVQGSFDLLTARLSESTNVLIRRLTFLSLMLGLIGAVAGVFGMNFETVYTESGERGFWIVVGSLLSVGAISLVISRLKRWI